MWGTVVPIWAAHQLTVGICTMPDALIYIYVKLYLCISLSDLLTEPCELVYLVQTINGKTGNITDRFSTDAFHFIASKYFR